MKKISLVLAALLTFGSIGSAYADRGHRGYHHDYRPHSHHQSHHHGHRHHRSSWVGPAAVLAITGMAIGAAAYHHSQAAPVTVYTAPPPPANNTWYYCGSSGQYYPYTNVCPEGWQAVPAR